MARATFKLTILNAHKVYFNGEATNVILHGDETEYEVMPFHTPLIGVLKNGDIMIDNKFRVHINRGLVKFYNNECSILVEEKIEKEVLEEFKAEIIKDDEN